MTVRSFGPSTPKVAPRNAGDVTITKTDGTTPTFTSGPTVSSGAVSFSIDDGGHKLRLEMVTTNASGETETTRIVLGGPNGHSAVTAGPAAGTAPSALTIAGGDSDLLVGVTVGTSPATGVLLHVAFAKDAGVVPNEVIGSDNAASEVCQPFVTNVTSTGFDIGVAVAPSAAAVLAYSVTFDKTAQEIQGTHPSEGSARVDPSLGATGSMDAGTPHG